MSGCVDSSTEVLDAEGLFVLPGYVDPHFHVGGSQLSIEGLAEVLVPIGTAALATCFYEPGFIAGLAAVESSSSALTGPVWRFCSRLPRRDARHGAVRHRSRSSALPSCGD